MGAKQPTPPPAETWQHADDCPLSDPETYCNPAIAGLRCSCRPTSPPPPPSGGDIPLPDELWLLWNPRKKCMSQCWYPSKERALECVVSGFHLPVRIR